LKVVKLGTMRTDVASNNQRVKAIGFLGSHLLDRQKIVVKSGPFRPSGNRIRDASNLGIGLKSTSGHRHVDRCARTVDNPTNA
jgi:hypothetical protein